MDTLIISAATDHNIFFGDIPVVFRYQLHNTASFSSCRPNIKYLFALPSLASLRCSCCRHGSLPSARSFETPLSLVSPQLASVLSFFSPLLSPLWPCTTTTMTSPSLPPIQDMVLQCAEQRLSPVQSAALRPHPSSPHSPNYPLSPSPNHHLP